MRVGLLDRTDKLFQVEELGILGGGILSCLTGSAFASGCCDLELLRIRVKFSLLRKDGVGWPTFSGSDGVEIWLMRSPFEETTGVCV